MDPLKQKSIAPSPQPALELIALAKLSPELARRNLRALLLANPNYFGNVSGTSFKAVLQIQEDTTYESICGVGYNPELDQLRATINVKQANGYSGDECATGSKEYVRFYLSYDGGTTWRDQGLKTIHVCDAGPKPLESVVTLQVDPGEQARLLENLPRVRAILSWNFSPPAGAPGWTPVWGSVAESQVKIEGSHFIPLDILSDKTSGGLPKKAVQVDELGGLAEDSLTEPLGQFKRDMLFSIPDIRQSRFSLIANAARPEVDLNLAAASLDNDKPSLNLDRVAGSDLAGLVEKWLKIVNSSTSELTENRRLSVFRSESGILAGSSLAQVG